MQQASREVRASITRQNFTDVQEHHVEAWIRNRQVDPTQISSAALDREVCSAVRICRAVPFGESEAMAQRYGLGRPVSV